MSLTEDEHQLLQRLPRDGSTLSNRAIQRKLGWDDDHYWAVRDALVDAGLVVRGRGRGGTVRRAMESATASKAISVPVSRGRPTQNAESVIENELGLYEPMRRVLIGDWSKDHRSDPLAVEVTALQGRRETGGIWSRPDLVSVEIRTFAFVPGKHLELATFEVKTATSFNVQSVFEALAHRRAATRSYVVAHIPMDAATAMEDLVVDVADVARSHGIGLITAGEPEDYDTWDERVEATRVEPDPERLDSFIATQLSERTKSLVSRRLR